MKKTLNSITNQLSNLQLENLTKETIAFDLAQVNNPVFTVADLWNIQRNARSRTQRRFL